VKKIATVVTGLMLTLAGVVGISSPASAVAPGYCPAGPGQNCFRNFANCTTTDSSAGAMSVVVYHVRSSGGLSTRVYFLRAISASDGYHKVLDFSKTSGGGGTTYWTITAPFGDTHLNGTTHPEESYGNSGLAWASISQNPVVKTRYQATAFYGGNVTHCNVPLDFSTSYIG